MTVLYLGAPAAIAVSLSVLMAGAWVVQQRTGNSGWVDQIWTFSPVWPAPAAARWPAAGAARQRYPPRTSQFFPLSSQA